MADGKIQIRGGKLLAANGKLTRVDSCCCEDLGPPECECSHSLPDVLTAVHSSPLHGVCPSTTNFSLVFDANPANMCTYEGSQNCPSGVGDLDRSINWDKVNNIWVMSVQGAPVYPDTEGYNSILEGGTDPCDPTGVYMVVWGDEIGDITVGVP